MKTKEQVQKALAGLQELKKTLPETSPLGEPIHAGIDAQVKLLEIAMLESGVNYEDDFVYNCAVDAIAWAGDDDNEADLLVGWQWAQVA